MELLLNLIWLGLAAAALVAFAGRRRVASGTILVPWRVSLMALGCVVVLLFPIVSASDDLHPTQAVMEDASKRTQLAIAPLHLLRTAPPVPMLPAALAVVLLLALMVLQPFGPMVLKVRALDGAIVPSAGRAPPSVCGY